MVCAEKYTVARSPDENDRTELLRQVEPIDYTEDRGDLLGDYTRSLSSQGYQAQGGSRFTPSSSRPGPNKPPRGIFDDI
jgi:hypothetical protein